MSALNDNPFGKPELDNPFSDPSVSAAAGANSNMTRSLDDYNPFDGRSATTTPAVVAHSTGSAPYVQPAPMAAAPTPLNTADMQRRQDELEQRAKELERREEELRNMPYNVRPKNWPPLPSIIPIKPCFYQDINVEIPVEFQKVVRYMYYLWLLHVGVMVLNMIFGLFYLFVGGDLGVTFGLGLFYLIIFTPLSFVCWFRPVYNAFRNDSSFNFILFFGVFTIQTLISVLNFLGIGGYGACGLILAIQMLAGDTGGKIFVGVGMMVTAIGFGILCAADAFALQQIHSLYRSSGASVSKAKSEFTNNVMANETVRDAAASTMRQAAQNTFNQATSANSANPSAPRY